MKAALLKTVFSWGRTRQERHAMLSFVEPSGSLREMRMGRRFDSLSARIKQLEGRMAEKAKLKMHIINYAKTRDVYTAYKRSRYRESFRNQHREELEKHEAAKAAFDALGGKTIPKVAELSKEYAALLEEKKQCYEEYKAARQEMIDFQTAKRNVVILGKDEAAWKKQQDKEY